MMFRKHSDTTGFKRIAAGALTALALFSTLRAPTAYAASQVGTATANVILREGESSSTKALSTIKKGNSVEVLSTSGSWAKVKTGSLTGYVYLKYLTVTAAPSTSSSTLKRGDQGQEVKELQQALISLGYLSADATGTFGSATEEAVKKFQKNAGLTADGLAGSKTLAKIQEKANADKGQSSGDSATGSLKRGDESSAVTELQNLLKSAGYFNSESTGYFGSLTETAVKNFQRASKLTADGIAGAKTLSALRALTKPADNSNGSNGSSGTTTAAPSGSLKEGDESDAVLQLQKKLIEKGYLSTEATGFFGSATRKAVMQFQKEMNLTADGIAGSKTLEKLFASASNNNNNNSNSGSTGSVDTSKSLKKGDENDDVKQLQKKLIEKGYLSTEATGFFGTATEAALKKFQKDNGLTQDGVAGAKTLELLNGSASKTDDNSTGSSGTTSAPAGVLKKGDESDEVKKLQKKLIEKGYLSTEATGFFGTATEEALKKFQKDKGLTQDGIAGTATLNELYRDENAAKPDDSANKDDGNDSETATPPDEPVQDSKTNGNVVLVDWWSDVIVNNLKRGETAEVKDVLTGITFTIARYGGSNHLDAEPLTPEDSRKYFECFGYIQTWNARPIHITIKGVTYAAAMNGMPHGGERIADNDFNGQFCIHFLNSRTHGGNQVNQDMQKQIMVAFEAGA